MKNFLTIGIMFLAAILCASAADRSFTIAFGVSTPSTNSLTNANFTEAVTQGRSYIAGVTSVVSVFPENEAIRLSSNKTNGKFNIALTQEAQVVAKRIVINASRYDNDRDADAMLMVNSEPLYIESIVPEDYTIQIPSRPQHTLTNLIVDAERRVYIHSITVVYDSANGDVDPEQEQVAAPRFTPASGRVSAGTLVEISCDTPGATIHYTIDGTIPTSTSEVYTEPFQVFNDLTVNAFAVYDGMTPSDVTTAEFSVHNPGAEQVAEFDFSNPESLTPALATPEVKEWISLDGQTFTDGDVAILFESGGQSNTVVRLYHSYDAGTDVRLYDGDLLTIRSINPNFVIESAEFVTSLSGGSGDVDFSPSIGTYEWLTNTWTSDGEGVREVVLQSVLQSRMTSIKVTLKNLSGVEAVDFDHDEQAVYYNLQGVRVGSGAPAPGFYIRISGRDAQKVIIR